MIVEPITSQNRPLVVECIRRRWYTTTMVVRGELVDMTGMEGFLCREKDFVTGLVTYRQGADFLEILSLDSFREGQGIGSRLLEAAVQEARRRGCRKVILITTNDNLNALGFYQKRGFDMTCLFYNAMEKARQLKPEIPLVGEHGIPLRHEIQLERLLNPEGSGADVDGGGKIGVK